MFLRGSFPCVFFLAIGADRPRQYGSPLKNLLAVYWRFQPELDAIWVVRSKLGIICNVCSAA